MIYTINNKKVLALAVASALTLTACGGESDSGDGGSDSAKDAAVLTFNTEGATGFTTMTQPIPSSTQKNGYAAQQFSGEVVEARTPFQCESFMKNVGTDENGIARLEPLFEFGSDADLDKFGAVCEVQSAIATESNLYLQGEFMNFKVPAVDDMEIGYTFLNCSVLKVPMADAGGDIECIAKSRETDGEILEYSYSALTADSNADSIYYSRKSIETENYSLFKYNENQKLTELFSIATSDAQKGLNASGDYEVYVTSGDYVAINYGEGIALVDSETKESKIVSLGHTGSTNAKMLGLSGKVVTELTRPNYVGSMVIDLENGEIDYLSSSVRMDRFTMGSDDSSAWTGAQYNDELMYRLASYDVEANKLRKDSSDTLLAFGFEFAREASKQMPKDQGLFVKSKVGDENFTYVPVSGQNKWGELFVSAVHYIDLADNEYHDKSNLLDALDLSAFEYVDLLRVYSGGLIVSGKGLNGGRVRAYLDQQTLTEYFPTGPVESIHTQIDILR